MFEGQRLTYVVPGYTGYKSPHSAISLPRSTKNSEDSKRPNPPARSRAMPDMSLPSNPKTSTAILSEKRLNKSAARATSRDRTMRLPINTLAPTLLATCLLPNDSNVLLRTSWEFKTRKLTFLPYLSLYKAHHKQPRKRSRPVHLEPSR